MGIAYSVARERSGDVAARWPALLLPVVACEKVIDRRDDMAPWFDAKVIATFTICPPMYAFLRGYFV